MFIPNTEVRIGQTRKLSKDVTSMAGTIIKGSEVVVVSYGVRGYSIRDVDSGQVMLECGMCIFEPLEK